MSYSHSFCLVRIFLNDSLTLHLLYSPPPKSPCVYEMSFLGLYEKVLQIYDPKYSEAILKKQINSEFMDK